MCCFAQPVQSVTDTNLFARLTDLRTQFLAYQMKFSSQKPNAMILPLPVSTPAAEDSVRFISLKGYDRFFGDLDKGFPDVTPKSRSRKSGSILPSNSIDKKLVVHEVGDFIASFVPSVEDFSRLDRQFVIPKESWDKIPVYSDYGFAVFQLKKLQGTTHPMAFEFQSRLKDQVFFPTVHIHDGKVHSREDFDHTLYLQAKSFDDKVSDYRNRNVKDRMTGFVRSRSTARNFCNVKKTAGLVLGDQLVHRLELRGRLKNQDVIASLTGNRPFKFGQSNFQRLIPFLPASVGLAGLGWVFHRREKLGQSEEE